MSSEMALIATEEKTTAQSSSSPPPPPPAAASTSKGKNIPPMPTWVKFELSIKNIDTARQVFSVDGWVDAWWRPNPDFVDRLRAQGISVTNDRRRDFQIKDDGYILPLNPDHLFHNSYDFERKNLKFKYDTATNIASLHLHFKSDFHELFELSTFPFDRQLLNITFHIRYRKGYLIPDTMPDWVDSNPHYANNRIIKYTLPLSQQSVWKPLAPVVNYAQEVRVLSIPLERLSSFYMSNVFLPLFLIGLISVITFSIEDLADRTDQVLTIILTIVAFKFLISSLLPETSYMTIMDHYFVFGYFFLLCTAIEHVVTSRFVDEASASDVDDACSVIFGIVWCAVHLCIVIGHWTDGWRREWDDLFVEAWEQETREDMYSVDPKRDVIVSSTDTHHYTGKASRVNRVVTVGGVATASESKIMQAKKKKKNSVVPQQ